MDFPRSSGLPIPNVYGCSPTSDNVAETEYTFMEFVHGTKLSDIWFDLEEPEIESVVCQLVQLEARMMSVSLAGACTTPKAWGGWLGSRAVRLRTSGSASVRM